MLPDRYAVIRKILISLRSSSLDLSDNQRAIIQAALANLYDIEKTVERSLSNPSTLKAAKFNSVLSIDIDNLVEMLVELKSKRNGG